MTERENEAGTPGNPVRSDAVDEVTAAGDSSSTRDVTDVAADDTALAKTDAGAEEPQNRRARRAAAARARKARGQERAEAEAIGLDAQEMIDEALTRGTDSAARWLRRNATVLQVSVAIGLVTWAGWGLYKWRTEVSRAQASDVLALALSASRGELGDPEKQGQPNEQGVVDPTPIFKDAPARQQAVHAAFERAATQRTGSPAAGFAELGLAGALLDEKKYDEALRRFESVKSSAAAKTDAELFGRAQEGIALAREGKSDFPGALAAYKDLSATGTAGFVAVGLYGQARLAHQLGDDKAAVEAITALNTKLAEKPSAGEPLGFSSGYLKQGAKLLSDVLGVQPPAAKPAAGPQNITSDQLKRLQREVQEKINHAGSKAPDGK